MEKTVIEGFVGDVSKLTFDGGILTLDIFDTEKTENYWLYRIGFPVHVRVTIEEI